MSRALQCCSRQWTRSSASSPTGVSSDLGPVDDLLVVGRWLPLDDRAAKSRDRHRHHRDTGALEVLKSVLSLKRKQKVKTSGLVH